VENYSMKMFIINSSKSTESKGKSTAKTAVILYTTVTLQARKTNHQIRGGKKYL
jgi:hypothetical protein